MTKEISREGQRTEPGRLSWSAFKSMSLAEATLGESCSRETSSRRYRMPISSKTTGKKVIIGWKKLTCSTLWRKEARVFTKKTAKG